MVLNRSSTPPNDEQIMPMPIPGAELCEQTEAFSGYWKKGAWNEPNRESALTCMEQAVNGWKNLAYDLARQVHYAGRASPSVAFSETTPMIEKHGKRFASMAELRRFETNKAATQGAGPTVSNPAGTAETSSPVVAAPVVQSAREASSEPDARERLRKAMLFIEEWSNWWSYALAKDDNEPLTPEEDAAASKMAESLGARARDMVIDNRRFLAAVGPGGEHG